MKKSEPKSPKKAIVQLAEATTLVAISELRPHPRNSRVHSPEQIKQLAAAIREFGFTAPIIANKDNTVLAGHGRLEAAKMMGMEKVPVVRVDMPPDQARRYILADNKLAELSTWDQSMLDAELADLVVAFKDDQAPDLDLAGMFSFGEPVVPSTQRVPIDLVKPHPRNYRAHPEDQLEHIRESIRVNGIYRNVIVAQDYTILAGHGLVQALRSMGAKTVPVLKLSVAPNDPKALKVLAGDNEVGKLGEINDRALTEMLKEVLDSDGLLGTGFNEEQLAALLFVTRPASEIKDEQAAAHWVGLPEYDEKGETVWKLVISFPNEEARLEFTKVAGVKVDKIAGKTWSTRWPWSEREDAASVRFEASQTPPDSNEATNDIAD